MPCASTPDARPSPNAGRRPACVKVLSSVFPATAEEGPFPGSYRFRRLDFELLETNPGAQHFADTPGLSEAAARRVRWVAVEDLADRTDAGVAQIDRKSTRLNSSHSLRDPLPISRRAALRRHSRPERSSRAPREVGRRRRSR